MSKRQKYGLFYIAAALFCIIAGALNIKNDDIVFTIMAFATGVVFAISGIMQMKYAKEAAIAAKNKKNSKKNKGNKKK